MVTDSAFIRRTEGSKVSVATGGVVQIEDGEALLWTNKSITVNAGKNVIVKIAPRSIVHIASKEGLVSIKNIADRGPDAVAVVAHGYSAPLLPGREVLITDANGNPEEAMKSDTCARRRTRIVNMNKVGKNAILSEVSLMSFVQGNPLMHSLSNPQTEGEKLMLQEIVKMAACISLTSAGRGHYSTLNSQH